MKALRIDSNKNGKRYALVQKPDGYGVYVRCENYSRHVRGGIAVSWRYCEKGLSLEQAEKLFQKKIGNKKQ